MSDFMISDPAMLSIIVGIFLLAGTVKGVIGFGLPTISLGLLAATLGLQPAMALLIVPSLVTNVWQALIGGHTGAVLRRIWPFLVAASATVWLGALVLVRLDPVFLSGLLGILLVCYAGFSLGGIRISIPSRHEVWAGPVFGAANGILTGMTGSFLVPGVLFLQAIGLSQAMLIQAMGMLFTASTLALALALKSNHLLTADLGVASLVALLPALLGVILGRKIRQKLSEARFRQVFFTAILALGAYILLRAAFEYSGPGPNLS